MLDYLFTAYCANGTVIHQTPKDTSLLHPKKSAFYDVMQNLPLVRFELQGKNHLFAVNYLDGSIEIDGGKNYAPHKPADSNNVRPIYYRIVTQIGGAEVSIGEDRFGKLKVFLGMTTHIDTKYRYGIGWQADAKNGKHYEFKMEVE